MRSWPIRIAALMPASAFGSLNLAQRFRDAHLARALVDAAEANGAAFLLAGNGHVRTDRAVPWFVRAHGSRVARIVSVMLLEVREGEPTLQAICRATPTARPRPTTCCSRRVTDRPDPCQQMREQFSKKQ